MVIEQVSTNTFNMANKRKCNEFSGCREGFLRLCKNERI